MNDTTQLDMFNDKIDTSKGKYEEVLEPIDYTTQIGIYKELKDVKGVENLSDKAMEMLHYLYTNHAGEYDGFIHAQKLAGLLGYYDTREIRKLRAEINEKTELVVYSSQHGYKLASNELEIEEAVRFALAPALRMIKQAIAISKNKSQARMLQGFIGNVEKEFGGNVTGQKQYDDDMELREVNHFPKQPFTENVLPINERIEAWKKSLKTK